MKLRIHKGAMKGRSFDIKNDILFIGRAGDNEIQILDPYVSRRHAKLLMIDNRIYIEDLMSRNGTWVNGSLIRPGDRSELKEGLCFSIGDTVLCLDEIPSDMDMVMNYAIDPLYSQTKSIGEEPNAFCPQRYKDQVNRLLGGLLHDFNNLLMCIQGNSSLILFDMDENNPHYKRLKQIEEYVEKGAEITDKILALMEGSQIRETS